MRASETAKAAMMRMARSDLFMMKRLLHRSRCVVCLMLLLVGCGVVGGALGGRGREVTMSR